MEKAKQCWITEGYGCPYFIGGRFWDTYKCSHRSDDSPCEKEV